MLRRKSLAEDAGGVTVVEFAIGAPIVLLIAVIVIEVSFMLAVRVALDIGTREAARAGLTGAPPPAGSTRDQQLRKIMVSTTFGFVDPAKLTVSLLAYQDAGSVGKPEPFSDIDGNGRWDPGEPFTDVNGNGIWDADRGAAGAGTSGQTVAYLVQYTGKPLTGLAASLLDDPTYHYESRVVVRNEPF
ncbi:pilus assembly protein (plasmid) [Azospirillum argentinense]|uniref:Pilus assembly protein n=1 Tax=Azospirillum argentinense TaxID=2970906 RepID=A0A4D8PM70_9PROT|nr:TadE family protein [Azospirillum argentinense]QCN98344.1 pilus assembly protein [Azospirillum argentinense]